MTNLKQIFLIVIIALMSSNIFAQSVTPERYTLNLKPDPPTPEKYSLNLKTDLSFPNIDPKNIKNHIETLCSPEFDGRQTGTEGNYKAMQYIISELRKRDVATPDMNIYEQHFIETGIRGVNIIGIVEGSELADESILITSHYDGIGVLDSVLYPGADGNATGVAAMIELAGAFTDAYKKGLKPKRTIIFAAFDGSKKDLLGSKHYKKFAVKPISLIRMLLNMDMIGHDDCGPTKDEKDYVYMLGIYGLPKITTRICDSINNATTKLSINYTLNNNEMLHQLFYPKSDHYPFSNMIPTLFVTGGINADIHQPTDTPDKISIPTMIKRIQLVYHLAWYYANS